MSDLVEEPLCELIEQLVSLVDPLREETGTQVS